MTSVTRKIFTNLAFKNLSKNLDNKSIKCWNSLQRPASNQVLNKLKDNLIITDACVEQIKKATKDEFLRVTVEGGGCSGFSYKFDLDLNLDEDDRVFEKSGIKVVTDEGSLELIKGSTIDYEVELIKSAFRIKDNPQSGSSCSCGVSFSVDL